MCLTFRCSPSLCELGYTDYRPLLARTLLERTAIERSESLVGKDRICSP